MCQLMETGKWYQNINQLQFSTMMTCPALLLDFLCIAHMPTRPPVGPVIICFLWWLYKYSGGPDMPADRLFFGHRPRKYHCISLFHDRPACINYDAGFIFLKESLFVAKCIRFLKPTHRIGKQYLLTKQFHALISYGHLSGRLQPGYNYVGLTSADTDLIH
jgi:hypothetical protein